MENKLEIYYDKETGRAYLVKCGAVIDYRQCYDEEELCLEISANDDVDTFEKLNELTTEEMLLSWKGNLLDFLYYDGKQRVMDFFKYLKGVKPCGELIYSKEYKSASKITVHTETMYIGVVANETKVKNESVKYVVNTIKSYTGSKHVFKETTVSEKLNIKFD